MNRSGWKPNLQLARVGFEPTASPGLSRSGRPIAYLAVSTLDGIRTHALHLERVTTTPDWSARARLVFLVPFARTPDSSPLAQVGVEPTASLVLSESGLPVAYRAMRDWRVVKDPAIKFRG